MQMTQVATHKARKEHRCDWCWQAIEKGAEYQRYRYYRGSKAGTVKLHPKCMDEIQDEDDERGGFFEWTPGQGRPAS